MVVKEKVVREARIKKEYTQEYIANLLDISQSKYSRLEKGEISFDLNEFSKLVDILDLNPLEVLDFTEKQQFFINSSYSGNINSNISVLDEEKIREIIKDELKKKI
ncbi:helix-turn-helix domain-containing protein [Flavobacterium macrobrachii]|jgi:transcriptional regulator with XRE-family HTH domain|uniref:helix-turn-helix domain-containing protein n=1 Tax=Flavobacterium macrobrachii TaxID=591204 RepID=UPI0037C02F03